MQHISVSLKSILRIQYKGVRDYNRSKYKIYTENERSKIHLGTIFAGRIVSTVQTNQYEITWKWETFSYPTSAVF
jgi:hypothetical protein